MSNILKKIFSNKTKKNRSSPGIEMQVIPYSKRLGKKTTSKKTTSVNSIMPRSPPSRRRVSNKNKKIYRERVKKSKCRRRKQEDCVKYCKYTKGPLRKYCRKIQNERIQI